MASTDHGEELCPAPSGVFSMISSPGLLLFGIISINFEAQAIDAMSEWRFKVLFDGECPFCLREVRWLQQRNRHGHLAFEDVSSPAFDPARFGSTREELLRVIHGVFPDGRIVRKVEVFRHAYRAVGLGWLIAPTGWPLLRWVFEGFYFLFARYRVPLGRLFGRSCTSGACSSSHKAKHR